jgi:hypothetical protein
MAWFDILADLRQRLKAGGGKLSLNRTAEPSNGCGFREIWLSEKNSASQKEGVAMRGTHRYPQSQETSPQ